jgi:hypothetical protein
MGLAIDREQFDTLEYQRFSGRLDECLAALERMVRVPASAPGQPPSGRSWS